jgi:hypothetical protein
LDTSFIKESHASALCINVSKRIIAEIEFYWNYLECSQPPSFRIIQSGDHHLSVRKLNDEVKDFGVLQWYLNNRFGTALRKNWIRRKSREEMQFVRNSILTVNPVIKKEDNEDVQRIVQCGFSRNQAIQALKLANNNVNEAINLLMDGLVTDVTINIPSQQCAKKDLLSDNMPLFNQEINWTEPAENFFGLFIKHFLIIVFSKWKCNCWNC